MRIHKRYLFIIFIIVIICIIFNRKIEQKNIFDSGKDTVECFGNGEYQLMNSSNRLSLFNCKYHECVLPIVDSWIEKADCAYIIGKFPITFHDIVQVKIKIDLLNNIMYYYPENISFENLNIVYANSMLENGELIVVDDYNYFISSEKEIFTELDNNKYYSDK